MRVVAGSHKTDYLQHVDTYARDNLLSRGQEVAVDVDEAEATAVVLRAGEMSLHHVKIIHGSTANVSDTKRVGFAARYTVPATRQAGERWPVVLARGRDNYRYFEVQETPPSHDLEKGLAAQAESARRLLSALTDR
jgi:ectoine hydroxylase-related dioxygenase (phytanoyl-CoA dioxygenase family)